MIEITKKIELIMDLPIPEKHGCKKGRQFEVTREQHGKVWFVGDAGDECAAWNMEYKEA